MKLSTLIAGLDILLAKNGDLHVSIWDDEIKKYCSLSDENIKVRKKTKKCAKRLVIESHYDS